MLVCTDVETFGVSYVKNEENTSKPKPGKRFSSEYQPAKRGRPPGRSLAKQLCDLLEAPYKAGDHTMFEAMVARLHADALAGNTQAAATLLSYSTPKPAAELNVQTDSVERVEWVLIDTTD